MATESALAHAAYHGELKKVEQLIAAGAHLGGEDGELFEGEAKGCIAGRPTSLPLGEAARNGQLKTCKTLLEAGAPIDAVNYRGETALILAADWGQLGCGKLLIAAGANVHIMGCFGNALAYAATNQCNLAVARALLEQGCRPNQKDAFDSDTLDRLLTGIPAKGTLTDHQKKMLSCLQYLEPMLVPEDRDRVASVLARGTKVVTKQSDGEQKLERTYRSLGAAKAVAQPDWAQNVRKHLGDIANAKARNRMQLLCKFTLPTSAAAAHAEWPEIVKSIVVSSWSYGDATFESYGKRLPVSKIDDDEGGAMDHYADEHLYTFDWVLELLATAPAIGNPKWAQLVIHTCKQKAARVSFMSFGDEEATALLADPEAKSHSKYKEVTAAVNKAFPYRPAKSPKRKT
jgi:hypothetical protein